MFIVIIKVIDNSNMHKYTVHSYLCLGCGILTLPHAVLLINTETFLHKGERQLWTLSTRLKIRK